MKILATILALCWITGCATMQPENVKIGQEPFVTASTTSVLLAQIPPLDQPKITIAVYSFPDLTGQRKPNSKFSLLSCGEVQSCSSPGVKGNDLLSIVSNTVQNGTNNNIEKNNSGAMFAAAAPVVPPALPE